MNKGWKIHLVAFVKSLIGYKEEPFSVFDAPYDEIAKKMRRLIELTCFSTLEIPDGYYKPEESTEVFKAGKQAIADKIALKLVEVEAIEFTSEHIDDFTLLKGELKFLRQ